MRATATLAAALTIAVAVQASTTVRQRTDGAGRVAITFDDLPVHSAMPAGFTRATIASRVVEALRARQSPPVYGFINAKALTDEPDSFAALKIWREAEFPLGNHGFAHLNLHTATPEAFEHDIIANEPILQSLMPQGGWHWFRYPFLNEGDTPAKHRRIADFLKARRYRVAQVTISFDDWAYSEPYVRCAAKRDQAAIEQLEASYMKRAAESLTRSQQTARVLFGRDIDHIMLLHIGAFTALMLPDVLNLLDARGFRLITLEEAAADAAYTSDLPFPAGRSGTLFDQLMSGRNTEMPQWHESPAQRLATICK
jgi:peptidoglycan/xylan/chitin deacetylase (PgdA/CDA1 family)